MNFFLKKLLRSYIFFGVLCVLLNVVQAINFGEREEIIAGSRYRSFVGNEVDIIMFSFDRPLQLYALLESIYKYCSCLGDLAVIYRVSNAEYDQAYNEVRRAFPEVNFVKQGRNPHYDFKPLFLRNMLTMRHPYICLIVDDVIITDEVNFATCTRILEHTKSYAFYLNVGLNITACWMSEIDSGLPQTLHEIEPGFFQWRIVGSQGAWYYPNNFEATIYRKRDIANSLRRMRYNSPNTLEVPWWIDVPDNVRGICYAHSKMVNLPLNLVNDFRKNKNMGWLTAAQLLEIFNKGLKIDIEPLHTLEHATPHVDYKPEFIARDCSSVIT